MARASLIAVQTLCILVMAIGVVQKDFLVAGISAGLYAFFSMIKEIK